MECKALYSCSFSSPVLDLIDTLWNVKFYLEEVLPGDTFDLIDTLWNVKEDEEEEMDLDDFTI